MRNDSKTWQRARVVSVTSMTDPPVGFEFWVRSEAPRDAEARGLPGWVAVRAFGVFGAPRDGDVPHYESNVVLPNGRPAYVMAAGIELLPEFCDDPPLVPWRSCAGQ